MLARGTKHKDLDKPFSKLHGARNLWGTKMSMRFVCSFLSSAVLLWACANSKVVEFAFTGSLADEGGSLRLPNTGTCSGSFAIDTEARRALFNSGDAIANRWAGALVSFELETPQGSIGYDVGSVSDDYLDLLIDLGVISLGDLQNSSAIQNLNTVTQEDLVVQDRINSTVGILNDLGTQFPDVGLFNEDGFTGDLMGGQPFLFSFDFFFQPANTIFLDQGLLLSDIDVPSSANLAIGVVIVSTSLGDVAFRLRGADVSIRERTQGTVPIPTGLVLFPAGIAAMMASRRYKRSLQA